MNENSPTLCTVDLEGEDTVIEYNELMEEDVKEGDFSQDVDESEDGDKNADQYQCDDEDDDDNGKD